MISLQFRRAYPYPPEFVFDLLTDFDSYVEFVPGVLSVKRGESDGRVNNLALGLGYRGLNVATRVEVDMERPTSMKVSGGSGPVQRLTNNWTITPLPAGSLVSFDLELEFGFFVVESFVSRFQEKIINKLTVAFEHRAATVWAQRYTPEPATVWG